MFLSLPKGTFGAGHQRSFPTSKGGRVRMHACSAAGHHDESSTFSPLPTLKILYNDGVFVAVDKPRGMYVHPPEDKNRPVPKQENAMYLLKRQLGGEYYIYPLHRIDRATSGIVVYALSSEAASEFGTAMRARAVHKVYYAFVRGYTDTAGVVDDGVGGQEALTMYETVMRVKLPMQVGRNDFPLQRYSLVRVVPLTGRFHQIRRHFNYISHPIIGDGDHGDSLPFLEPPKTKMTRYMGSVCGPSKLTGPLTRDWRRGMSRNGEKESMWGCTSDESVFDMSSVQGYAQESEGMAIV
ncbi:pseudouridine synthase [Dunaliella salina]|uniref:Pseudouridine synthase n=1 Tax=Dunaliella salina TaxID=3046 RepID=A0ABQ7FTM3_DUNSA|nr:pseudouridine synthase [Dunaliella salina]|eukprot:KAF5825533.1 pseudouridine synthase [Dunaliella salina]